jgi:predicted DNA-binding protein YlxM (UPF0122 family)
MSGPKYRNEAWLRREYVENNRSLADIADECSVTDDTVNRWTKRFDLTPSRPWRNESWLREQLKSGKTIEQIAKEVETATSVIYDWRDRHDIETPDISKDYHEEEWLVKHYREENLGPTEISELSEWDPSPAAVSHWVSRYGIEKKHRDPEWLHQKYVEEGLSTIDIADICGVCSTTIANNLRKNSIEVVSHEEKFDKYEAPWQGITGDDHPGSEMTGEDHPNYLGLDISNEWRRSGKWKRVKVQIRERDEYTCRRCGEYGKQVHHKEPVSIGGAKYDEENLEVLCSECHQYVHWHTSLRDYRTNA